MTNLLKIAFVVRSTIDQIKGGDSLQLYNTANELRKLGVDVVIKKAHEPIDYREFDLLHLFNVIRPADHLKHLQRGVPFVVSTIYLDYSTFDTCGRSRVQRQLFSTLGKDFSEYCKNNFRFLSGQDKLVSKTYLLGHQRAVRKILKEAAMLLPNSLSEYKRLSQDYGVESRCHVVPNGIDKHLFEVLPKAERIDNQVLCVGQIYGLKNQHRLIEATRNMDVKLVLIGKPPPNHLSYYRYCKKIAHSRVHFHDFMPQEQLIVHYAKSKVHALPSWFETTGLSSLEAGSMGCNLVVGSGGDTRDYFQGFATFCAADDVSGIKKALEMELQKPTQLSFREHILKNYTWENAAKETLIAYKKVLKID
ncbi:MAG: glycosyltransferase family 4 protein [Bacteroidales bacterium]|nr:glycosyltransferase family 4 protein [Bacteroidales bacterium]